MTDRFRDRSVLVTGGASGIGAACARRFAGEGAVVFVADHDEARARSAAESIAADGGRVVALAVDVTDPASVERAVAEAERGAGGGSDDGLAVAVNCAGIHGSILPLAELSPEEFDAVVKVNQYGVFHSMRHEIQAMKATGGGVIVNLASIAAHRAFRGEAAYAATKFAVLAMTRIAAREYADAGIRVMSISPGLVQTPMADTVPDAEAAGFLSGVPLARSGTPDEVAELVAFLCSAEAGYLTGVDYVIDGGYTAK